MKEGVQRNKVWSRKNVLEKIWQALSGVIFYYRQRNWRTRQPRELQLISPNGKNFLRKTKVEEERRGRKGGLNKNQGSYQDPTKHLYGFIRQPVTVPVNGDLHHEVFLHISTTLMERHSTIEHIMDRLKSKTTTESSTMTPTFVLNAGRLSKTMGDVSL